MSHIEKLAYHEQLMKRMAEANGADVALAEQVGLLTPEETFEATLSCTSCAAVRSCEAHMDGADDGLPDFCRNSGMITRLKDEMTELGLAED